MNFFLKSFQTLLLYKYSSCFEIWEMLFETGNFWSWKI